MRKRRRCILSPRLCFEPVFQSQGQFPRCHIMGLSVKDIVQFTELHLAPSAVDAVCKLLISFLCPQNHSMLIKDWRVSQNCAEETHITEGSGCVLLGKLVGLPMLDLDTTEASELVDASNGGFFDFTNSNSKKRLAARTDDSWQLVTCAESIAATSVGKTQTAGRGNVLCLQVKWNESEAFLGHMLAIEVRHVLCGISIIQQADYFSLLLRELEL
ncbi:hypothetical protein Nepgr_004815 [Nepenthes gracilis]|uniref:Uncharacterized protein n=1 Tax=Nepenthes gracilis TaxID=150966 RepID=A0AAD3S2I8_NEPGR|nr:hypothetical protein Nepgr_004815 [Nepenthes gracilis]